MAPSVPALHRHARKGGGLFARPVGEGAEAFPPMDPRLCEDDGRGGARVSVHCAPRLSEALDAVAERAPERHRFLRHAWYAAALQAYGGNARTLVVEAAGIPVAALPFVAKGPRWLGVAEIPGCYWPFRSFPVAEAASATAADALLGALARQVRALRIGPVQDGDPALDWLMAAARAKGWTLLDRHIGDSFELDLGALAAAQWPSGATLRKNRYFEKQIARLGRLDWQWGAPPFDELADVERRSWIGTRTDGSDAKFTADGHGAFWRAAARDPALAAMFEAAVLRIDGRAMAFAFRLTAGARSHVIANSYDPAIARHSPGRLLAYRDFARGLARGVTNIDWGAGDSGYKQALGARRGAALRDWILVRPGPSALVAQLLAARWRRSGQPAGGQA